MPKNVLARTWVRRDRENGTEELVTEAYVTQRLVRRYNPLGPAMKAASRNMPLTTGFADYWPLEGKE